MISMVLTRSTSTSSERARIRKQHLREMERQQSKEDLEALRMTDVFMAPFFSCDIGFDTDGHFHDRNSGRYCFVRLKK
jgi:hypothetical protein